LAFLLFHPKNSFEAFVCKGIHEIRRKLMTMHETLFFQDERLGKAPHPETIETMRKLPKVDLHRHLEGSLYPEFVFSLMQKHKIPIPVDSVEALRPLIQITPKDKTLLDFIAKFDTLALLFENRKIVRELTYEIILEAHRDSVRYVELRFAPTYMAWKTKLDFHEIMEGVLEGREAARKDLPDIQVGLIVIVNREAPLAMARQMLELALEYKPHGIVGMDLAGDEVHYPPELFGEIFQEARQAGLFVTLHAGEARGPESVQTAVLHCQAQRIGHGVRIAGNKPVESLVVEKNIFLEVCPTSNVQTGAVPRWEDHPIRNFLEKKIPMTVNTDDPGVSGITLSHEYARLHELYNFSLDDLRALCLAGAEAAFLPHDEKEALKRRLAEEWNAVVQ
jgi:adenosine deaminase